MITLLLTLLVVVVLWFAVRTLFGSASHPRNVLLFIDLLFLLFCVLLIVRFAGYL